MTKEQIESLKPELFSFAFSTVKHEKSMPTHHGNSVKTDIEHQNEAVVSLSNGVTMSTPVKPETMQKIYDMVLQDVIGNFGN